MGIFADVWQFVEEVAVNWRTGIAVVVFLLFSFPNAVLSDNYKVALETRFPIENRRKVLALIALIYIVIACFLAWEEEHTGRLVAEGGGTHNERHLTDDQKIRLSAKLQLRPDENYIIQFNSVPNCEECEDYAQELREFFNTLPGWKGEGGVLTFSGFPFRSDLHLSINTALSPKIQNILAAAFGSAGIILKQDGSEITQKDLNAIIVVARRPK